MICHGIMKNYKIISEGFFNLLDYDEYGEELSFYCHWGTSL